MFGKFVPAVLALVGLSFAPAALAHDKKYTIGLAAANLQADFFNFIKESAEEEGARLGYEVIVVDSGGDDAKQVSQIQDLVTRGVDGLILLIAGHSDGSAQLRRARDAGVAVVCVDRNTTPACRFLSPATANKPRLIWANMSPKRPAAKALSESCKGSWGQHRKSPATPDSKKRWLSIRESARSKSKPAKVGIWTKASPLGKICSNAIPIFRCCSGAPMRWRWARRKR